jgi:glucosamine-6-phosphate isomerase
MHVTVKKDYDSMSLAAANFVAAAVKRNPKCILTLPSGDTPTKTLKNLVVMAERGEINFQQTHFVGLDEWVGMDRFSEGSCQHYIYGNFFHPVKIRAEQITFFDAKASDLMVECKNVDDHIKKNGPIDLVLVGVGVNGHIGLNEPGTPFTSLCHTIDLEDTTKSVAQKYFQGSQALQEGITLGISHIMNAKAVVVIANGMKKTNIIQKIIEGPVTESVPGSILQRHQNCHFFIDEDAAAMLKRS